MKQTNRIQILSKLLIKINGLLMIILPLATFITWIKIEWFSQFFANQYDVTTFDIKTQAFGLTFSLIPLGLIMFGLYSLQSLFRNYAIGQVFYPQNAKYIKRFAWVNILGGGLTPIFGGIYSVILSMNRIAGERFLSVGIGATEIHIMLLGLVFVVIAHVMEAAHAISEENNQFV